MAKDLHKRIEFLEIKNVALRKVTEEHELELEKLKNEAANPAPPVRTNIKKRRMIDIAKNYRTKWMIGRNKKATATTAA